MGYKTNLLVNAVARVAVSELLMPALQQVPGRVAASIASQRWSVHLYALSRANPRESFCCVTSAGAAVDPFAHLEKGVLSTHAPVFLLPSRFEADQLAGLGIRPSSSAAAIRFADSWMAQPDELVIDHTDESSGVTLLHFHRQSDGMQFVGARSHAAAQAAAAQLGLAMPLWRDLMHHRQGMQMALAQLGF